ncbi:hypothetical protein SAMN05444397_107135 [Flavobacterium aquidurense]|nr:hypothetical protein SAMN05444397_107135 [Flavobacterium aquidurense]
MRETDIKQELKIATNSRIIFSRRSKKDLSRFTQIFLLNQIKSAKSA